MLIAVEDLFHVGPPFVRRASRQRLLAGLTDSPPALAGFVRRHRGHVGGEVAAGVLEIAEEIGLPIVELAQVDRVVLDVRLLDASQDVRPYGGVQPLVLFQLFGAQAGYHGIAFHSLSFIWKRDRRGDFRKSAATLPRPTPAGRARSCGRSGAGRRAIRGERCRRGC